MREIKFRAWDEENRFISRGNLAITGDGVKWWLFAGSSDIIDARSFTIEQYTGLKDKNGKEIYEGDIIKGGSRTMQVVFKQSACQFWLVWKDNKGINRYEPLTANYGDDGGCFLNDSLEVIGNIHENNELINNK